MIYVLDLLGVAIFAITGAITAGQKKMDIFGVIVVATVTAVGGGTTRDLVLGMRPFWVSDPLYIVVCLFAGLGTFVYVYFAKPPLRALLIGDAFGLAIFTIIGCQKAIQADVSVIIIIVMGIMTGVTGGMIRDVLCGEIPLILRREIYATASLTGGVIFVILNRLGVKEWFVIILSVISVLTVRWVSVHWHLSLPVYKDSGKKAGH
jgi:uncharacterized membrane protein YeiH